MFISQVSTAIRFTTVPDATPPSSYVYDTLFPSQPPTTITAVLNPILGHISAAYASRVSQDLALCSRYDFNVYSYESEWTMGAEWWVRRPSHSTDPVVPATVGGMEDDTQGVLKARISTNYVSHIVHVQLSNALISVHQDVSLFWEGRLSNVLLGIGVVSDLGNRSRPVRALGLEVAYFS